MSTTNFIVNNNTGSGVGSGVGNTQPADPGFWNNNGVLTYWDGNENKVVDFNEGENTSLFGTPVGDE